MGMLREKMQDDLRLKGYCETTRRCYLGSAQRFAEHYGRSPATMGEQEVRGFLLHLVKEKGLGPAGHFMHVAALQVPLPGHVATTRRGGEGPLSTRAETSA